MKHLNSIAHKFSLLLVAVFLFAATAVNAQWNYIGETEFSEGQATDVCIDVHSGVPYLAYTDHANIFRVTVMKHNGANWVPVGFPAFTAPTPDPYDISFKMNGSVPYLAFVDRAFQNQGGIENGKMTVMKFNGGIWVYVGLPGFSAGNAGYPLLAVDNGIPYVAFSDETKNGELIVMKFDGNDWTQVGTSTFPAIFIREYDFAVQNGTPYIAYFDKTLSNKSFVKKFDGSDWVNVGDLGFTGDIYSHMEFAVSENGTPFLVHSDSSTNGAITALQFDGNEWTNLGGPGAGRFSFNLDGETPYVVFSSMKDPFDPIDPKNLSVVRYKDAEWQLVGPMDIIGGHFPNYLNIVIENGVPYLGYQHNAFGGGATAMKYTETSSSNDLLSEKTDFRLYPNPSHGGEITFYIQNEASEETLLQIFNLDGRQFFEQKVTLEAGKTAYPVQLPDLPAGVYFAKLTVAGNRALAAKLVITR